MDSGDLHDRALAFFGERVHGVGRGQWHAPTPCPDWDVRALVNHNVVENHWAGELLAGRTIEEVGDRFDGDLLGDDPVGAWDASAEVAGQAVRRVGTLDGHVEVSYGSIPARKFVEQRSMDLLVHGWDLAVATGQQATMPLDVAEAAWQMMDSQREQIRASRVFGPEVTVPADADPQTRLLGLLGRDPSAW